MKSHFPLLFVGIDISSCTVDDVKKIESQTSQPLQYIIGIDNRMYQIRLSLGNMFSLVTVLLLNFVVSIKPVQRNVN